MNKKQLIVAWVITAILCFVILFAPKKHIRNYQGYVFVFDTPDRNTVPAIQWDFVLQRSLIVILIGGLLIYSLRDKKK